MKASGMGLPRTSGPLGSPGQQQQQPRSPFVRSNRQSPQYIFSFAVVGFILLSILVIAHFPSESFTQIDAELRKIQEDMDHEAIYNKYHADMPDYDKPKGKRLSATTIQGAGKIPKPVYPADDDSNVAEEHEYPSGDAPETDDEDMYFRDPKAPVADWHYFPPLKQEIRRDPSWAQAGKELPPMRKEDCDAFLQNIDTSPPPRREPSNEACNGYDGVFQIQHYDKGGASGTSFFMFNVGMLAWADQHNYLPWIHIEDNYTWPIWDPIVHTNVTKHTEFTMMEGMEIGWSRDPDDPRAHLFPGKPFVKEPLQPKTFVLNGTGVWEHYFLPVNDFVPGDLSCRDKPIVKMDEDHIVPGMHANAPWAPRAWRYAEPDYVKRWDLTWDKFFKPQRRRGAEITDRYIRFNPMIEKRVNCAFPDPEFSMGMHIRHSDKVVERRVIHTDEFLVFAKTFVWNGGRSIYIATDSTKVIDSIMETWPEEVISHVVYQGSVLGRSTNTTAAFDIGVSRHRTNVEALTDVLALSKCTFFLHGLSAMSEAVLYLNPGLISRSLNLEEYHKEDERFTPTYFVNHIMPLGDKLREQS